jgi:hypothetical protein
MRRTVLLLLLTMEALLLPGISLGDDDFSSDLIDGSKWRSLEYARYVDQDQGVLRTAVRTDSLGEVSKSSFRFSNPQAIAGVRSEVVLHTLSVTQNDADASAKARICGAFYNSQTTPTSQRGEVWAEVVIGDRGNGLEAYWHVVEFTDDEGSEWNDLDDGILVAPGTLSLNTTYVLELVYDEAGGQLHFAIQDSTGTEMASADFACYNRQRPARKPDWFLSARAQDDSGYVDAEFDNVYTKATVNDEFSLYDTFDRYDAAKWHTNQTCRLIENGQLIAMIQSLGDTEYTISSLQGIPDYFQAEVAVSSESEIAPGDFGTARLDGYFFNDRVPKDQQTGSRGNIFAAVAIEDRAGDLSAWCYLLRVLDDEDNQTETVWEQEFDNITIQYDTVYTLSVSYTHTALIFSLSDGVNTQRQTYTIPDTTPVYPANGEYRSLRTLFYGSENAAGGVMKAAFDNIVTKSGENGNGDNSDGKKSSGGGGGGGGGGCFLHAILQ